MNILRKLAVVIVALGTVSLAQADLISFEIDGSLGCGFGGGCAEFAIQTGLDPYSAPFRVQFTFDPSAIALASPLQPFLWSIGSPQSTYFVEGPNMGLEILLGDLELEFSQFYIAIGSSPAIPGIPIVPTDSVIEVWGPSSVLGDSGAFFAFQLIDRDALLFNEFSLQELAEIPLTGFRWGALNPAVVSANVRDNDAGWNVTGAANTLRQTYSVPEPSSLALLGLGLLGMRLARRWKSLS